MPSPPTPPPTPDPSVAVTGLGAMGSALARNIARTGRTVHIHNRSPERVEEFLATHPTEGRWITAPSLRELIAAMLRPRVIIAMIPAGDPVDALIAELSDLLDTGDVIVDAGNSFFADTERRAEQLAPTGLGFIGMGVSGGESGALWGPSLMPAGDRWAYDLIEPMLLEIAAQADGEPCCAYLGTGGAGHYVKMVHNGIEYADMGAISECVATLGHRGLRGPALADQIAAWNRTELASYLLEITIDILRTVDDQNPEGGLLWEQVADRAAQKGTGRLTVQEAFELGEPATTIAEATAMRSLSGLTERRALARSELGLTPVPSSESATDARSETEPSPTDEVAAALLGARLVALTQGFDLLAAGSAQHGWALDLATIARLWRAGCIIRSALLNPIADAFARGHRHLFADPALASRLVDSEDGWRATVIEAIAAAVPVPVLSSGLAFLDALRSERLPTALIQAQRDAFGAHTYERTDREGTFHSDWGGAASAPPPHE